MGHTNGKTLTHEERMALIMKPIPAVRYIDRKPWSGTITGDHFYMDGITRTATIRDRMRSGVNADGEYEVNGYFTIAYAIGYSREPKGGPRGGYGSYD